jgi:K+-transporting ATPase ATPase B chain
MENKKPTFWKPELIRSSIKGSFLRLDPRTLWHNPVMFVVEIVSVITTIISISASGSGSRFSSQISPRPSLKAEEKHKRKR